MERFMQQPISHLNRGDSPAECVGETGRSHQYPRWSWVFVFMVLVGLFGLSGQIALAAPPVQGTAVQPVPVLLGQYVYKEMAKGETSIYTVDVPEQASYLISAVDAKQAAAFDLVAKDASGNEVFNDVFANKEFTSTAGTITFTFTAADKGALFFVVNGYIGAMSSNEKQPGALPSGGIYAEDKVSDPRYAILTVPQTSYPQQVLLDVEPGQGDAFTVTASGGEIGSVSINSADSHLLHFWSQGGEYTVTVAPVARRSQFTLLAFLGGRPTQLPLDQPLDGSIAAGTAETIYELPVDTALPKLSIELTTTAANLNLMVVDKLYSGNMGKSSFGEKKLDLKNLAPGTYYVIVEAQDTTKTDIPFTLNANTGNAPSASAGTISAPSTGTAGSTPSVPSAPSAPTSSAPTGNIGNTGIMSNTGAPAAQLVTNKPVLGEFKAGEDTAHYEFDVSQAGAQVIVTMQSDAQNANFVLSAALVPGKPIWSSSPSGSNLSLSFVAPAKGKYYIDIASNGATGHYTVMATEGNLVPTLALNTQTWGSVDPGKPNVYHLEVREPNQLLTIILIGKREAGAHLDVVSYSADGSSAAQIQGSSDGSTEIVSQAMADPGVFEVSVTLSGTESSDYVLVTQAQDSNQLASQWASAASASSQYGETDYAPSQVTGEPNTLIAGDFGTAWAASEPNAGQETLTLTYTHAVVPYGIQIHETYNPGAVVAVEAYDTANQQWTKLWEGKAGVVDTPMRVFSPRLTPAEFATATIRLVLDTSVVDGWNEIDAVQLLGRP